MDMKTAQLTASVSRKGGGLFPIIQRVSQCLTERGVDVSVFGLEDEFTQKDLPQWAPLRPIIAKPYPPRSFGFAPSLLPSLKTANCDLTHVHGIWMYPSLASLKWSKRSQRPYIVSPQGMLDRWALANSRFKKLVVGKLYEERHVRGATCIHALSRSEADSIRQFGIKAPICIIPNGVDFDFTSGFHCPKGKGTREGGRKIMLFLGRLHPKKGLLQLLSAWDEMKRLRVAGVDDWELSIAGWSQNNHQSLLEKFVAERGLNESVTFVGPLFGEPKLAALRSASGFILPSLSEGLPIAVLEAWAHRLPVAITEECNLPQGFSAQAAVKLTPDKDGIVQGMRRFLQMTDQERAEMGQRGFGLVQRQFNWNAVTSELLSVYEWMLGGGTPPACVETY